MKLGPNQKKWIELLRSGKVKQGRHTLCRTHNYVINETGDSELVPLAQPEYCCLGVLCLLDADGNYQLDQSYDILEDNALVARWGLNDGEGRDEGGPVEGKIMSLAEYNDKGKTFEEIADMLESRPEAFFTHPY